MKLTCEQLKAVVPPPKLIRKLGLGDGQQTGAPNTIILRRKEYDLAYREQYIMAYGEALSEGLKKMCPYFDDERRNAIVTQDSNWATVLNHALSSADVSCLSVQQAAFSGLDKAEAIADDVAIGAMRRWTCCEDHVSTDAAPITIGVAIAKNEGLDK